MFFFVNNSYANAPNKTFKAYIKTLNEALIISV